MAVGGGLEMNANRMYGWLERRWEELDILEAIDAVKSGRVVVCAWHNPGGIGHVAMMLENGNIAQAGASCFVDRPIAAGFGKHQPSFFAAPGVQFGGSNANGP
jgi:cell wall-associated NlpC family hydrolase